MCDETPKQQRMRRAERRGGSDRTGRRLEGRLQRPLVCHAIACSSASGGAMLEYECLADSESRAGWAAGRDAAGAAVRLSPCLLQSASLIAAHALRPSTPARAP